MNASGLFLRTAARPTVVDLIRRRFRTSAPVTTLFYEKDPKGGYGSKDDTAKKKKTAGTGAGTAAATVRRGLEELAGEVAAWTREMKSAFEMDPTMVYRPGETDVVWKFDGPADLERWLVTADSDHNEGYSTCSFDMDQRGGVAVFSGDLCTRMPEDGRVRRAGYCNLRSKRARKSFKRDSYHDWTAYNMLCMRVRGDGRSYMLNLACSGNYDVLWNDVYHYVLFTRGGPYWQDVRLPFSKFFLASKGRIQDTQGPVPLHRISNFGITVADKIEGPFRLEIESVGVQYDPAKTEEYAYEMYETDRYIPRN